VIEVAEGLSKRSPAGVAPPPHEYGTPFWDRAAVNCFLWLGVSSRLLGGARV
jgi:hypothetical protein